VRAQIEEGYSTSALIQRVKRLKQQ
jgi:hypothetical protein